MPLPPKLLLKYLPKEVMPESFLKLIRPLPLPLVSTQPCLPKLKLKLRPRPRLKSQPKLVLVPVLPPLLELMPLLPPSHNTLRNKNLMEESL